MHHLKVPVLFFLLLLLLQCVRTAPKNRFSISSTQQEEGMLEEKRWMTPGFLTNPFLQFVGLRPQRELNTVDNQKRNMEKRRCNTATCMTQRLADFLIRSSNTVGTVYIPTNIGANTYGKRDAFQLDMAPL